ncbi:MAG TPA: hypothetical protein VLG44_02970 [Chlamydiales bacterium]|nr:hypothetical protein [Chlamydiales bacterium]
MTTISLQHPLNRSLLIDGNYVVGIGDVTIRESLGCFTKFTDWICCSTRVWQAYRTNLGIRHIDVQDDDLRKRLDAVYNPLPIAIQHRPITPARTVNLSLNAYHDTRLLQCCRLYIRSKARENQVEIDDSLNAIRNIMEHGGDPFLATVEGETSFRITRDDLALIKVLTRTENVRAFDHCKDIHDFWDVIYPPSTHELPEGHEEWIRLMPQNSLAERLQKVLPREEIEAFPSFEAIIEDLRKEEQKKDKSLTAQDIFDHLRSRYPAFETICREFGSNLPKIIDLPSSFFSSERVHVDGFAAHYHAESHTIRLEETHDLSVKFVKLFFEMMNALQRGRFEKLGILMITEDTRLPREGYVFLMEYIEHDSARAFEILVPRILDTGDIRAQWILQNRPTREGLVPHAFHFRRLWDKYCAWPYVCTHRAEFQDRLKKLST